MHVPKCPCDPSCLPMKRVRLKKAINTSWSHGHSLLQFVYLAIFASMPFFLTFFTVNAFVFCAFRSFRSAKVVSEKQRQIAEYTKKAG